MDKSERRKELEARLAKAEDRARKSKDAVKAIRGKIKELDKPEPGFTHKQDTTRKIWHGVACLALMEKDNNLASRVRAYLEDNVKSPYQRRFMGLTVIEKPAEEHTTEPRFSALFGRKGPIFAESRVDLVVPYPTPDKEHEKAKAVGARWDGQKKVWYVPEGGDLTLFEPWLPSGDWKTYGLI